MNVRRGTGTIQLKAQRLEQNPFVGFLLIHDKVLLLKTSYRIVLFNRWWGKIYVVFWYTLRIYRNHWVVFKVKFVYTCCIFVMLCYLHCHTSHQSLFLRAIYSVVFPALTKLKYIRLFANIASSINTALVHLYKNVWLNYF